MEENHLEYGYLEGESIGGHFAEDPVGVTLLYIFGGQRTEMLREGAGGGCRRVSSRLFSPRVCAHVSSASRKEGDRRHVG